MSLDRIRVQPEKRGLERLSTINRTLSPGDDNQTFVKTTVSDIMRNLGRIKTITKARAKPAAVVLPKPSKLAAPPLPPPQKVAPVNRAPPPAPPLAKEKPGSKIPPPRGAGKSSPPKIAHRFDPQKSAKSKEKGKAPGSRPAPPPPAPVVKAPSKAPSTSRAPPSPPPKEKRSPVPSKKRSAPAPPPPSSKNAPSPPKKKKPSLQYLKTYVPRMPGTSYALPKLTSVGIYKNSKNQDVWICLVCNRREQTESSREMIGCDSCEDWYHTDCVDIDTDDVEEDDPWYCKRCIFLASDKPKKDFPKLFRNDELDY